MSDKTCIVRKLQYENSELKNQYSNWKIERHNNMYMYTDKFLNQKTTGTSLKYGYGIQMSNWIHNLQNLAYKSE